MKKRRRAREGQEKREDRRPILRKLRAALPQAFRGQHGEKMKGSARDNWDPREGQEPFRPNPNRVGDRTTTLRRLLIGAPVVVAESCWQNRKCSSSSWFLANQIYVRSCKERATSVDSSDCKLKNLNSFSFITIWSLTSFDNSMILR